ncbi:MAG: hypothetical protein B6U87_02165 [Candidatus Aenigmarchaeota archaeon ex4484_52]|nr:MAG: hypothetical protein B6U87_02165 [Candidatus Aenigmarchaeota archaeon ex4484_52]
MKIVFKKENYILFIVVFILFLSCCVGNKNTTYSKGNGVELSGVSFLPNKISSGETTKLMYVVQNNGDFDSDVELYLQMLDDKWTAKKDFKKIDNLEKKQQDVPGGKEESFFELTAPELKEKNTHITYNAEIKMCYLYKTQTIFKYNIIDSFDKQKEIEQGKYKKSLPFFQNSASPLSVSPLSKQPLFITKNNNPITLVFEVKNNEDGLVSNINRCTQNPEAKDINNFEFEIETTDSDFRIKCDDEDKVRLVNGKITFYCTLDYNYKDVKDKNSVIIELTSKYAYFETQQAKISVSSLD